MHFQNSDGCQFTDYLYTMAQGILSSVKHGVFTKMDHSFSVIWSKTIALEVKQEGFAVTSDEASILFSSYSDCTVAKILTSDGSISLQKSINSFSN